MGKLKPEWPMRSPVMVRGEVIGYVTGEGGEYGAEYQSSFLGYHRTYSSAEAAILHRHLNRMASPPRTAGEQR